MRGRDRARLTGGAPRCRGRAVAPIDRVRPRAVVHPGVRERGAEREAGPGARRLGGRGHRGRDVRNGGGSGRRRAREAPLVGDREGHRVGAVIGVRVARPDAGAAGAITEIPGVRDGITVRVRRGAAVEADGAALGTAIGSARCGYRCVVRGRRGVVAQGAPGIGERLPGDGDELPGVRARVQGELEHPPRAGIPYLAVRHRRRTTTVEAGATGAHDERADAVGRVEHGSRVLRREALIAVLVAVHHDLRAVRVQGVPQRLIPRVTGDVDAGDEPGLVPIGERAAPAVEREVAAQPLHLGRAWRDVELAVDGDDVPIAEVVAVITFGGIARGRAEVAEIPGGRAIAVFMVAGHRPGPRFVPSPRRVVVVRVFGGGTHLVGVVAQREHGARDAVQQIRGERVSVLRAVGDITGTHQDRGTGRGRLHGERIRAGSPVVIRDRHAHGVQPLGGVDV